jgi:hypothetical protein
LTSLLVKGRSGPGLVVLEGLGAAKVASTRGGLCVCWSESGIQSLFVGIELVLDALGLVLAGLRDAQ